MLLSAPTFTVGTSRHGHNTPQRHHPLTDLPTKTSTDIDEMRAEVPQVFGTHNGFAPLGDANSVVKQQIFADNATRFYKIKLKAADNTKMPAYSVDRLTALKKDYASAATEPSNLRYGYVRAA